MSLLSQNKIARYSSVSDLDLISLIIKEQKTDLFEILYDRYAPIIYRKCVSLTQDQNTAKDLMQDIMLKIFLNISQFEGRSNFSLWVNTISYNHCMQYFKLKKRLLISPEELSTYEGLAIQDIEEEHQELQQIKVNQLRLLLEKLKPEYRLILVMRYFSDMSVKEIAESLEIGESAVKMRLKRGRSKLAELFHPLNKPS
jgi:RNA polymerase sigma-70 factor (ECF subfamily)